MIKFEIIPNKQTPRVYPIRDVQKFVATHSEELKEFLSFAKSISQAEALAANQVSLDGKRLTHRYFAYNNGDTWKIIINPTIDKYIGEKQSEVEECLSFTCKGFSVMRSPEVKVSYYDIDGNKVEGEMQSGLNAQIWQHEVDHLDGVKKPIEELNFVEKAVCQVISKFDDGGTLTMTNTTELLAPNGKKSNLTDEQYRLVRTSEFISWFGDWINSPKTASKIVDQNGEPLVLYHGTERKFNVFDTSRQGRNYYGNGFYFANLEEVKKYVGVKYKTKRIISVFLSIKKLFILNNNIETKQLSDKYANTNNFAEDDLEQFAKYTIGYRSDNPDLFQQNIKKDGYDGLLVDDGIVKTYIAYYPEQIKLADGSNTTFDGNNPDIRFENGGVLEAKRKSKGKVVTKIKRHKHSDIMNNPAFVEWFKGSKVIDVLGSPLKVYHGTTENFYIFDIKHGGKQTGVDWGKLGFFFSPSKELALDFTKTEWSNPKSEFRQGSKTIECYLSIKNPRIITARQFTMQQSSGDILREESIKDGYDGWIIEKMDSDEYDSYARIFGEGSAKEFKDNQYVAFYPNQIKLADGSNTEFDINNPDIRYERGGVMSEKTKATLNAVKGKQPSRALNDSHYKNTNNSDIQYKNGGIIQKLNTQLIEVEPAILTILKKLDDNGFHAVIVGGAVRDALLKIEPKDIDIEVYKISYDKLNDFLSEYGKVDLVGKSFGVIKFKPFDAEMEYDFSIPRMENKIGIGHKEFEVTFDENMSIKDAAMRRDFTFNALAYDPITNTIYDYFGGIEDLKNGIIRHTSDKFSEDALRILRAMQFQARFGFAIHPDTIIEIKKILIKTEEFNKLPKERAFDEWIKWAEKGVHHDLIFSFLRDTTLIDYYPMLKALKETPQDPIWHPEGDVEIHTTLCLAHMDKIIARENIEGTEKVILVTSILLHDIAKPPTTKHEMKNDRMAITSNGHEALGGEMSKEFLSSIGFHEELITPISNLVANHLAGVMIISVPEKSRPKFVKKLSRRLAPATIKELLYVMEADNNGRASASFKESTGGKEITEIAKDINVTDKEYEYILKGRHLIEVGMKPSKKFGEILAKSYEAQENGEFSDLEGAKKWLNDNLDRFKEGGIMTKTADKSNLTKEQQKLIHSPEFIGFFGDWINSPETASKIVDENGEPLVLYHSTNSTWNIPEMYGLGLHLGTLKSATDRMKSFDLNINPHIKELFVNIRNVLYLDRDYRFHNDLTKVSTELFKDGVISKEEKNIFIRVYSSEATFSNLRKLLKEKYGFDGIAYRNNIEGRGTKSYIIFEPNQIKLADGSNTTFDSSNPDIRYERGGVMTSKSPSSTKTDDIIYSASFKNFFGDWENDPENSSKVVDKGGLPLVVFHGTQNEFTEFDKEKLGTRSSFPTNILGFFFSGSKLKASKLYARWSWHNPLQKVMKCYLNVRNPYYTTSKEFYTNNTAEKVAILKEKIKNNDGIIVLSKGLSGFSDEYVAFYPEQIKLADSTNTTFDPINPDIRYEEGGEANGFENSENIRNFTGKVTKEEIQNVISGIIKVTDGETIQAAANYLRGGKSSDSPNTRTKDSKIQEENRLKKFISENNLWYSIENLNNYLDSGAEQSVYLIDTDHVIKLNDAIYYQSWEDYFNNLILHNLFFPATAYDLIGFAIQSNRKLYAVVKQPFIAETEETDLEQVRKIMLDNGFNGYAKINNNDYYNTELGLILEDLHEENVLTKDGVLYFIDTVFFIKENTNTKLSDGGSILLAPNGKPSNLSEKKYKLVRTPEFIRFFGDWINSPETASKVVDENNEPLLVYHGSTAKRFSVFSTPSYFTDKKEITDTYKNQLQPDGSNYGNTVYEVFLNIRRPKYLPMFSIREDIYSALTKVRTDGVIAPMGNTGANEYIVKNPTQIKLADGTNIAFDSTNPDIRMKDGGELISKQEWNQWQKENTNQHGQADFELKDGTEITFDFVNLIIRISKKNYGLNYTTKTERFTSGSIDDFDNTSDRFQARAKELVFGNKRFELSSDRGSLIEYAGGGEVAVDTQEIVPAEKVALHLPVEISVYVPSTKDADVPVSKEEMESRVREVDEFLSKSFGGFSSENVVGGYMSSKNQLIKENVVRVTSFSTNTAFEENKHKLFDKISEWAKEWSQEAVGFEYEGEMFYINQNKEKRYAEGGQIFERGAKENIENGLTESFGQAGLGVYGYVPNHAMREYYTKNGERLVRFKLKEGAEIVDLTKESDWVIQFIKRDHEITKAKMQSFIAPKVNKENFQLYGNEIIQYMNINHPNASAYIVPHKGYGIPTGKQVIVIKPQDIIILNAKVSHKEGGMVNKKNGKIIPKRKRLKGGEIDAKLKSIVEDLYKDHYETFAFADNLAKTTKDNIEEKSILLIRKWYGGMKEHFREEEEDLFPIIKDGSNDYLIAEIVREHRELESIIDSVENSGNITPQTLINFAEKVKSHIQKEDTLFLKYADNKYMSCETNSTVKKEEEMETSNGKQGGLLAGKAHSECDETGCGIQAVVTDAGGRRPVELEAEEVIITKPAMLDEQVYTIQGNPKQIASAINHEIGGGVKFAHGAKIKVGKRLKQGGVAGDLTIQDIADKWGVLPSYAVRQMNIGMAKELTPTSDPVAIRKMVKENLELDINYYAKLEALTYDYFHDGGQITIKGRKVEVGDEGMFRGGAVRIMRVNPLNVYYVDLDDDNNAVQVGNIDWLKTNSQEFVASFSKFPKKVMDDGGEAKAKEDRLAVATEIQKQIGHQAFYMLGSLSGGSKLMADKDSLSFRIKGSQKYNYVKVTLNAKDLYDIKFAKVWGYNTVREETIHDVHVEDMLKTIEKETGLYTKLFEEGGEANPEPVQPEPIEKEISLDDQESMLEGIAVLMESEQDESKRDDYKKQMVVLSETKSAMIVKMFEKGGVAGVKSAENDLVVYESEYAYIAKDDKAYPKTFTLYTMNDRQIGIIHLDNPKDNNLLDFFEVTDYRFIEPSLETKTFEVALKNLPLLKKGIAMNRDAESNKVFKSLVAKGHKYKVNGKMLIYR